MEPTLDSLLEDVMGFPNVTKHCLLHTVHVLAPNGIHTVLPAGGSHKIESFCNRVTKLIPARHQPKQRTVVLPEPPLIPSIDIHKFYSGATSVEDFTLLLERKLLDTGEMVDTEALQRLCWDYYQMEKKSEITFPKWLSEESTYRLWLIFNYSLERDLRVCLSKATMDEILKRLLHLCGYVWEESYKYTKQEELEFPDYLETITDTFAKLGLEMSLTSEVILDMVDEIVNGVLKKGYLTKKGHKRRNYKRRWFVLQRTVMRYYESREKLILKGELILNGHTTVRGIPDKGGRMYRLHVTCGHSGKEFLICADDQRMKHEWILAIKKAIALAKLIEGESESRGNNLSQSMSGFYLLKYGTTDPLLQRQDSEILDMKHHTSPRRFQQLTIIGKERVKRALTKREEDLDEPKEEYEEMLPGVVGHSSSEESDVDSEGYLKMNPDRSRISGSVDEYHNWSGSESLSSSITSDTSFGQTPTSPICDKFVLPGSPIPEIVESPVESEAVKSLEGSQDSLVYEHCDSFTPRYVPTRELNMYVGLTTRNSTTDSGRGSMSTDSPQPEEDSEVAKITEKLPDAGTVTNSLDKPSTPQYLTLLRSDEGPFQSVERARPPVPPRKSGSRSPVLEQRHEDSKPPPIRPRARTSRTRLDSGESPPPPPPPPRLINRISSPLIKLNSLPPPLPSRSVQLGSLPDYTRSVRVRRAVPKEPTVARRSASSSTLDVDEDNLVPPPLPPR